MLSLRFYFILFIKIELLSPVHIGKEREIRLHFLKRVVAKNSLIYFKTIIQPKCPPTGESLKNFFAYHTEEYYSTIKKNGVLKHVTMWMNVKIIVLSERRWTQKKRYCRISLI